MDENRDDEIDITRHLLEVEQEAEAVVSAAEREAEAVIASARAEAEAEFKTHYVHFVKSLESKEEEERKVCLAGHERQLEEYRESLASIRKDPASFGSLLEKLLYA